MKIKYHTLRNIEDALRKVKEKQINAPITFLETLSETKPGERENIVIAIIEPE